MVSLYRENLEGLRCRFSKGLEEKLHRGLPLDVLTPRTYDKAEVHTGILKSLHENAVMAFSCAVVSLKLVYYNISVSVGVFL